MTYTLTIPGRLPGLNEYINECRTHAQRGARMKRKHQEAVMWYIFRDLGRKPIDHPVYLKFFWYEKDKRRDLDNISSYGRKIILDALVKSGKLYDDRWSYVVGYADKFRVDKDDPRIVVQIIEQEGTVKPHRRDGMVHRG